MLNSMKSSTQKLCDLLNTEQLDRYLFRSQPTTTELSQVFGGQVLSQSLDCAIKTVARERLMHSMHAYFLRPGDIHAPIIYEVDPIRDGGTFTTRRVVAKQHGKAIFNTAISFNLYEEGFEHQVAMPDLPPPESLPTDAQQAALEKQADPAFKHLPRADSFDAFDRRTYGSLPSVAQKDAKPVQGFWFKTKDPLAEDQIIHQVILAYASDFRLMNTAMLPHGITFNHPHLQAASLDHALWIHRPIKADDWIYYDLEGPSACGGRGLNFGRFFNRQGQLIASSAQEGLMRIRQNNK